MTCRSKITLLSPWRVRDGATRQVSPPGARGTLSIARRFGVRMLRASQGWFPGRRRAITFSPRRQFRRFDDGPVTR